MENNQGVAATPPGLRPSGAEPAAQSQAKPLVPNPSDYDDEWDNIDCWNCDGDGYVFECFDGFCLDAEIGCDLCTRQCDVCGVSAPQGGGQ